MCATLCVFILVRSSNFGELSKSSIRSVEIDFVNKNRFLELIFSPHKPTRTHSALPDRAVGGAKTIQLCAISVLRQRSVLVFG